MCRKSGDCPNADLEPIEPCKPLQLVYVIDGSTLTTYNVDFQTLLATPAGTTPLLESVYPQILPSPNGHILYYVAFQNYAQQNERFYVYATNSNGVPDNQPIQTVNAKGLYSLQVDPTNKFLYVVRQGTVGPQYTTYTIIRLAINPTTGKVSEPIAEASYQLQSGSGGSEFCSLGIFGMNAAGTKLYDSIFCSYHGGASATYNERTVNTQTGALGPDQQVYSWNNSSGGAENVPFVKNLVFDFVTPNDYQQNDNLVNIYPLRPNATSPLIQCTAAMLSDCATDIGFVHPSAEYLFMYNAQQPNTDIDQVDLSSKEIVFTGSPIPYEVQQFSPDGTIAYGTNDVGSALNIQIYGFNVANAQVTNGGLISVPSDLDTWLATERH